jgi:hypothetical protein
MYYRSIIIQSINYSMKNAVGYFLFCAKDTQIKDLFLKSLVLEDEIPRPAKIFRTQLT